MDVVMRAQRTPPDDHFYQRASNLSYTTARTPQPTVHGPLYLMYVWVRASCVVAHRDYSSLHACKEEEEERCLFLEREW